MIETSTEAGTPTRSPVRRRAIAVACLLIASVVGGCSSSKNEPAPASSSQAPVGTDVASGVTGDPATEVTTSYLRFFDPTVAEAERVQLIQGGDAFSQAISQQQRSEFSRAVSVTVTKVTVSSAKKATVIFTLLLDGKPTLPNQTGYAVREGGKWKVAGATFCALLAAQGAPPPVCSTAAATTLPG
jgi:predicted cobalt transporter CbtA